MAQNFVPDPVQFQPPGREGNAWVPSFLQGVNAFVMQVVRSFQAVQASAPVYRVLNLATPASAEDAFPIVVPNPLVPRLPQDVHVAKVTSFRNAALTGAVSVSWSLTQSGDILVANVTGLDDLSTYEVVLSVS